MEHVHAALAIITNILEDEEHPASWIARAGLTGVGAPTQDGMRAFIERLDEIDGMDDWFDA